MKKLSIVTPCYNEECCIEPFVSAIDGQALPVDIEFVFVDDGSKDNTLANIRRCAQKDSRVHYVSFSRNFGKESALLAGLQKSTGDYVVTMDVDLQHSPFLLPAMLRAITEDGYDCAAARRLTRTGEPYLRSWFAHAFYWLMNEFSDVQLVDGSMDYRMMSRQVVNQVLRIGESLRFTKGIYQWVGFTTKWFETENVPRVAGVSKWSFWGLLRYSMTGILAFSTVPLQFVALIGFVVSIVAFIYMGFVLAKGLVFGDPVAGWPTLACLIMFLGGCQLLGIGILGTYVSKVFKEVKKRPIYITKEEL